MEPWKQCGCHYTACVEGHINPGWLDWPGEIHIEHAFYGEDQRAVSLITAYLTDPPALYALFEKLRDRNMKLVYVKRIEPARPISGGTYD